jgi:signal transduction histidine kinase
LEGLAATGRIGPYEKEYLRKDGGRSWMVFAGAALGDGTIVEYCIDTNARKQAEAALRRAHDELAAANERLRAEIHERARAEAARTELLRKLATVQEDERRRVSRELHDGVGQELTALILGLKAPERVLPEGSPGCDRLREVEAIVGRIGREAHELAVDLRPTALDDLGLGSALAAYLARWTERTGIAVDFQPLGLEAGRLPPEVETAIYRIVQEALNNAARHAGARRVSVIVERRAGEVTALVEDDGRGFDPARVDSESGRGCLGLLGIRERVGLVGGTFLVDSCKGKGTTVRARIPLQAPSSDAVRHG